MKNYANREDVSATISHDLFYDDVTKASVTSHLYTGTSIVKIAPKKKNCSKYLVDKALSL